MQSFKLAGNSESFKLNDTDKRIIIGAAAAGALLAPGAAFAAAPASIGDVTDAVTAIGTVTAGVAAIVLTAMGFRIAVKQVNRMTTKG